ncbi:hypothetical protein LSCM1_00291 [Leishmania martiniquensis]|uniref:Uncharacterized protein n=1 Tax=Leishmania martiniquensis TaxID=1580590 RepID=A0A836GSD6_9TRYP|nr:hypothetical protein LSCM1_00291 [Leishmania martiniquensis]
MHASLSSYTSGNAPKQVSTSCPAITGQRVTLSAKEAAANSSVDPKAAEVVRVSPFPERVVTLRCAGDSAPDWNGVVAQDHRCRQP